MAASVVSWTMTTGSARCCKGVISTVEIGMNKAILQVLSSHKCHII